MANDFFTRLLLALLTLGFAAWAGVVYQTGTKAAAAVQVQTQALLNMSARLDNHEKQAWHGSVGVDLSTLRQQVRELERRVNRIERKTDTSNLAGE